MNRPSAPPLTPSGHSSFVMAIAALAPDAGVRLLRPQFRILSSDSTALCAVSETNLFPFRRCRPSLLSRISFLLRRLGLLLTSMKQRAAYRIAEEVKRFWRIRTLHGL